MRVHGLEPRTGEPGFAFLVLRLAAPATKGALIALVRSIASLVPAPEDFVSELPDKLEATMRIVGMPWVPAADRLGAEQQRAVLAAAEGIAEVWCFQATGGPPAAEIDDLPFPVDGFPAILDELDREDFGLALKLAGPWQPGESTVLLGFHALWLAPYAGQYKNAAVAIDKVHHAAHLWVDRFAVEVEPETLVHHLLWIARALHDVLPVLHARFGGATPALKYGDLVDETAEPFVLGGNPLFAIYADGGEDAIDAWIADPGPWAAAEIAQMLRELAIDIVTTGSDEDLEPVDAVDAVFEAPEAGDTTAIVALPAPNGPDADEEDDDASATRNLTRYAGELLVARAQAGVLDVRAAPRLRALLEVLDEHDHRRDVVQAILGAAREAPGARDDDDRIN